MWAAIFSCNKRQTMQSVNNFLTHHVISHIFPQLEGQCHYMYRYNIRKQTWDKVSDWRSPVPSRVNIRALCGWVKCTWQTVAVQFPFLIGMQRFHVEPSCLQHFGGWKSEPGHTTADVVIWMFAPVANIQMRALWRQASRKMLMHNVLNTVYWIKRDTTAITIFKRNRKY